MSTHLNLICSNSFCTCRKLNSPPKKKYNTEQIDLINEGKTIIVRNAKIDMFKGYMRLAVDKWGKIEKAPDAPFRVNEKPEDNKSATEYELVSEAENEDS